MLRKCNVRKVFDEMSMRDVVTWNTTKVEIDRKKKEAHADVQKVLWCMSYGV